MSHQLKSSADDQEQVKVLHDGDTQADCYSSRLLCCLRGAGSDVNTETMERSVEVL